MRVGLFFGTFNPVHQGHLIIGNHLVENTDLDQVWFVVTPHNPHKKKSTLLDDYQRLEMVHRALESYPKLRPNDIEFKMAQPNYTVQTLLTLEEKYPEHEFSLIMGEDNLVSFHKWKNYTYILEHHHIYVYPRLTNSKGEPAIVQHPNIKMTAAPMVNISATFIRDQIKSGKSVRALMPAEAWQYLDEMNFYK
ncbi:MAG: nicotinate-nucleotide adenylyltransferase [Bacteroidetes bacterium]|nr:nicotinate-nucleotide adenylyltransferase [Bacteroidota bacterium]